MAHNMHRRARWHDYSAPGTYMLTVVTEQRRPLFGSLIDTPRPHIELSPFGHLIEDHELAKITKYYPQVHVWRYCIMPDHIHLIVNVSEALPPGKHLGSAVSGFKYGCNKAFWTTVSNTGVSIFQKKYNDRILFDHGQLLNWKRYLDDNPRRLSIKRSNPKYFSVIHDVELCGHKCQIFGNRFLLDIPDKMAVIVHRADTDAIFAQKKAQWLACGERGGVIISAAIAEREKIVMREALNRGYPLIWLRENGFADKYKPAGEAFDACASGQLLEISPNQYRYDRSTITRRQCLQLNAFAEEIAANMPLS